MTTLSDLIAATRFAVLEHLEAEAEVPLVDGLQAQGDVLIIPIPPVPSTGPGWSVPPEGVAVINAVRAGHEHRLFAGTPGTATWVRRAATAAHPDLGVLSCSAPAYLLHAEHGATGIAPGTYLLRRQREHYPATPTVIERLVTD